MSIYKNHGVTAVAVHQSWLRNSSAATVVTLNRTDEEATRNLMIALAKQGDTAAVKRVYKRLADALRELGAEPEPETQNLLGAR